MGLFFDMDRDLLFYHGGFGGRGCLVLRCLSFDCQKNYLKE